MPTENSEDRPLDARNSIREEAILSQCSNAKTHCGISPLCLGLRIG